MKDCKKCEYFDGYDQSDGTPYCTYEDDNGSGYENCPFNDNAESEVKGMICNIDMGQIDQYIINTISNTIMSRINTKIDLSVSSIIKDEYEKVIKNKTIETIDKMIDVQVSNYMNGEMTIGGGWGEKAKTLTRIEYLAETITKELDSKFKKDTVSEMVTRSVKTEMEKLTENLKQQINVGIKNTFDEVTRKTLAENVVTMLMASDTYTKLQNGMNKLLK